MSEEWIALPTNEEREKMKNEFVQLLRWSKSLSEEQIEFLCNGGWYNEAIRGYLIVAARNAKFSDEQIKELLNGLRWALSEKNKREAEEVSSHF